MFEEIRSVVEEIILEKLENEFSEDAIDGYIRNNDSLLSPELSDAIDSLIVSITDRIDEIEDEMNDRDYEEE